jgi:hypothetical protein
MVSSIWKKLAIAEFYSGILALPMTAKPTYLRRPENSWPHVFPESAALHFSDFSLCWL